MRKCIKRLLNITTLPFSTTHNNPITSPPIPSPDPNFHSLHTFTPHLSSFTKNFPLHLQIAKNSPLSYITLFIRSCLIAHEHISSDMYYSVFKKILRNDKYQLTPYLCASLMECLALCKFQGDQGNIVERLCRYYEANCGRFRWEEEVVFWESYMKVMVEKVHGSVKFVQIQRKKKQTLQFITMKQIVQLSKFYKTYPKHIISQISFPRPDQLSLLITPPSPSSTSRSPTKPQPILLHIKLYTNPNNYFTKQNQQTNQQNRQLMNSIISQIKYFKSSVNKDWNIVVVGDMEKWDSQVQYRYTDVGENGDKLGYVRSQKVESVFEGVDFGRIESLEKLMLSNRYIQGIFYSSNNPRIRKIDMITTLLLCTLSCQSIPKIPIFHPLSTPSPSISPTIPTLLPLCPLPLLTETYAYLKLCEQLQTLYCQYLKVQQHLAYRKRKQKTQQYDLDILEQLVQHDQINIQQAKRVIVGQSKMLAQMAVKDCNDIGTVYFEGKMEDGEGLKKAVGDMGWQFRPMFADVAFIMNKATQRWRQNPQKMLKLKIIAQRKHIPSIIDNILQCKYFTVPKMQPSNNDPQRQKLLTQIIKILNKK